MDITGSENRGRSVTSVISNASEAILFARPKAVAVSSKIAKKSKVATGCTAF